MDVRTRVLTARLAVRVEDNREYSRKIGINNTSAYKSDRKRKRSKC